MGRSLLDHVISDDDKQSTKLAMQLGADSLEDKVDLVVGEIRHHTPDSLNETVGLNPAFLS